jgi:hypothetical protein
MTVPELKEHLKEQGCLNLKGRKQELVTRLEAVLRATDVSTSSSSVLDVSSAGSASAADSSLQGPPLITMNDLHVSSLASPAAGSRASASPPTATIDSEQLSAQTKGLPLLNLPRLSSHPSSHLFDADVPEADEKLHGVQRVPHRVTGSTTMFVLHDRPHGDPRKASAHVNCMHRLPDLILQLRNTSTTGQEHFNRGFSPIFVRSVSTSDQYGFSVRQRWNYSGSNLSPPRYLFLNLLMVHLYNLKKNQAALLELLSIARESQQQLGNSVANE